jgi:hypothetical protein
MSGRSRKLKLNRIYIPLPTNEGDEIFRNGIFHFTISRILDHINTGFLLVEHVDYWNSKL